MSSSPLPPSKTFANLLPSQAVYVGAHDGILHGPLISCHTFDIMGSRRWRGEAKDKRVFVDGWMAGGRLWYMIDDDGDGAQMEFYRGRRRGCETLRFTVAVWLAGCLAGGCYRWLKMDPIELFKCTCWLLLPVQFGSLICSCCERRTHRRRKWTQWLSWEGREKCTFFSLIGRLL